MKARLLNGSRRTWLRLAGTLLAGGLLIYLLSQQGWQEILAAIRMIPIWRFLLALGLMLVSRLAVAHRWFALLKPAQAGISRWRSIQITFAGLFASNFLPTTVGGDVVRLAATLQLGSNRAVGAASIVVDRLVGLVGMATALPLGLGPLVAWFSLREGAAAATPSLAISFASLPEKLGKFRLVEKARSMTARLLGALGLWVSRPGALIRSLAFTWVHMLCKFTVILLLAAGMGSPIPLATIAGLWSFTYFVTLLPISINGLGVQEVSFTFIFTNIGGLPLGVGLTLALLIRTLEMAASLPGALFLPAILAGQEETEAA